MLYPIMSESRSVLDLSGIWDFRLDNGAGFAEKWYEKPLPDVPEEEVWRVIASAARKDGLSMFDFSRKNNSILE